LSCCKVSICIPTYNYGAYLPETIESILAQSFQDFELLIIDDNSDDDTRSVVESYAQKDPRIRFIVNPSNLGMVRNWNYCLELARGEYIKFVFGDDLLASPDAIGKMVEILDGHGSVSLVCSARNFIDANSSPLKVDSNFGNGIFSGHRVINYCLKRQANLVGEPSVVMFRRAQAQRGFLPNYRHIVDLEMWFHLLEQGDFAYLDEPLCSFRIHEGQMTQKNKESAAGITDFFCLLDCYLPKGYITLSPCTKNYIWYDQLCKGWKMQRQGRLDREEVLDRIRQHYSLPGFWLRYPVHKSCKPFAKLCRKAQRLVIDSRLR